MPVVWYLKSRLSPDYIEVSAGRRNPTCTEGFGDDMNIIPKDIADAVTTIISCKVEPWKVFLGLLIFAYLISKNNHVQFSGEICGKEITYMSEPVQVTEQNFNALPLASEENSCGVLER